MDNIKALEILLAGELDGIGHSCLEASCDTEICNTGIYRPMIRRPLQKASWPNMTERMLLSLYC